MFKPALLTVALLAAPALAQTAAPPAAAPNMGPPPDFIAAAQAFGTCVKDASAKLPASVTPEAGTTQALTTCTAQRTALDGRFEAWITGPTFPEAGRTIAREQYKAQMDMLPAQVADGIRKGRAAPAPAATPAPAPAK